MPFPQNGRHLGGDLLFVPIRVTDIETSRNKTEKDGDNNTTACDGKAYEQGRSGKEGEYFSPFAKTTREDREKRKRAEEAPSSPSTVVNTAGEDRANNRTDDEVFMVEGSPSPESARRTKKKKELEPFSTKIAGVQLGETEDESAMTNGIIQLMQKLENMAGEMTWMTKKNVNTKVEIKKLAREMDMMSQALSRKLHKYCKTVARKLRKFSDKDDALDTDVSAHLTRADTRDAASQTDSSLRKQRRGEDEEKRVTEATTDEEIIAAANQKWHEGWFKAPRSEQEIPGIP